MKQVLINIYGYDELPTEEAKKRAREEFWGTEPWSEWENIIREDACRVWLKLLNVKFTGEKCTFVSMSFVDDALVTARKIMEEHGENCQTYAEAMKYLDKTSGLREAVPGMRGDAADKLRIEDESFLEALEECYKEMAQGAYEHENSDKRAEEDIRANEWEFFCDGTYIAPHIKESISGAVFYASYDPNGNKNEVFNLTDRGKRQVINMKIQMASAAWNMGKHDEAEKVWKEAWELYGTLK